LTDRKLQRKSVGFFGRQTDNGTVFEQHAVQVAAWAVQLRLDMTSRLQGLSGIARFGWPGVDNRKMRGIIGDRYRLDECDLPSLQAPYGDLVAGLDREHQLRAEMRRQVNLGAIIEDYPVDLTARGQAVLSDFALDRRELIRVIDRHTLSEGRGLHPGGQQSGREKYFPSFHLTLCGCVHH
jgi:hypothetical protein